mgnify:CR=1 FL=1
MLPKLDVPLYEITLPLLNKKVKIRPFLVKEEKILLMAMETQDEDSVLLAIKQIVNNCCIDEIDVDGLPILDLEYLFLQLRARSIGEEINLQYKCNNDVKDEEGKEHKCGNLVEFDLNILEIDTPKIIKDSNKIMISDKLGLMMKYPSFNVIVSNKGKSESETLIDLIVDCIDYVFDENQIYKSKDTPRQELIDLVESLQSKDLDKIKEFFETIPKISKKFDFECKKCGYKETIELQGAQSFFV